MAEAKPRPSSVRPRIRPRGDGDDSLDGRTSPPAEPVATLPEGGARREYVEEEQQYGGFDEEVNNRYEEIKRGGTHISELQQMTMPQLLKVGKDEGITDS